MGGEMAEDALVRLEGTLAAREEVIWAYLFGSRARGRPRQRLGWGGPVQI
ncbi:MAG: hypothetical protein GX493_04415 [Firmicutes bacterium]|nr:hypothetical protein [Bacillota bacterium]